MDAYLIRSRVSSPFPVPPLNVARPIARVLLAPARTFERSVLVAPLRQPVRSRADFRFVLSPCASRCAMRACVRAYCVAGPLSAARSFACRFPLRAAPLRQSLRYARLLSPLSARRPIACIRALISAPCCPFAPGLRISATSAVAPLSAARSLRQPVHSRAQDPLPSPWAMQKRKRARDFRKETFDAASSFGCARSGSSTHAPPLSQRR